MSRAGVVRWVLKPVIWAVGLGIPAWLLWGAFNDGLGSDPVETIQRWTGKGALVGLLLTLAVSPLRRLAGWNDLVRVRRLLGLFSYFLATLHVLSYIVFDQALSLSEIKKDVIEHPWVFAGLSAWLLLTPLAVTSTKGWIRRLGGRRWQRLHKLIYVAAGAGVLHFLWLVKKDIGTPVLFGLVLVALLVARLPRWDGTRARPTRDPLDSTGAPR